MNTLIDVNVAFAIVVERHLHHPAAWQWWNKQAASSVDLCLPVRPYFLQLSTLPKSDLE